MLVNYGFRLPSALITVCCAEKNLKAMFTRLFAYGYAATTGKNRRIRLLSRIIRADRASIQRVEVRPTRLMILGEINARVKKNERTFITTWPRRWRKTWRTTSRKWGVKVNTCTWTSRPRSGLRLSVICAWASLMFWLGLTCYARESDAPEVSLVAILMRTRKASFNNERAWFRLLVAARNSEGHVIMYADNSWPSPCSAIDETAPPSGNPDGL